MFASARVSENHSIITVNLIASLHASLRDRSCTVYGINLRVRVQAVDLFTYPDVAVVCGNAEFADGIKDTLTNPLVLIEVLSDSTEAYDRGKKFEYYRMIPSLREYVLVAQDRRHVEVFTKEDFRWMFTEAGKDRDYIELASIECTLLLSDVYSKVEFEDDEGMVAGG